MKPFFADTFYYVALLQKRDTHHQRIRTFAHQLRAPLVTTRWVLTETANALGASIYRPEVGDFLTEAESDPDLHIAGPSDALYRRGVELYTQYADKAWSLTDCISFLVMSDQRLTDALTRDHHFEQAGYTAIFAD